MRVAFGQLSEHRRQCGRAEGERGCDPQAATQFTRRQNGLTSDINLGTDPGGVVAEHNTSLGQGSAASRPREELDAKIRFQSEQPPADDRLRDP